MQSSLIKANPLLIDAGFTATIDSLKATAQLKESESRTAKTMADWFTGDSAFRVDGVEMHGPAGAIKMETELKRLIQVFDLGTQDAAIKAEIVKSAEFRNALAEIEMKFMRDADITPGHVLQFLKLLFLKLTPSR
jgi:hypothetical protein